MYKTVKRTRIRIISTDEINLKSDSLETSAKDEGKSEMNISLDSLSKSSSPYNLEMNHDDMEKSISMGYSVGVAHLCTRVKNPGEREPEVFAKIPRGVKAFRKNC